MVKEIPLQNGMVALVDDEDFERCMEYVWSVRVGNEGSFQTVFNSKVGYLSRFILNLSKEDVPVSFKNSNQLDLRKKNLVKSNQKLIMRNAKGRRNTSSKYKGVSWCKQTKRWAAVIRIDGKYKRLGRFITEDEAAIAYNSAAFEAWGESCYLNIIGINNSANSHELERSLICRRKSGTTSVYRGVNYEKKREHWVANIQHLKRVTYLGSYSTEIEAAKAYDAKAIELHGDKAILNFPKLLDKRKENQHERAL